MAHTFLNLLTIAALLLGPLASIDLRPAAQADAQWVLYDTLSHPSLPAGLEVVEDYGSFVLGRMPAAQAKGGLPGLQVLEGRTLIEINNYAFDSAGGEPDIPDSLRAAADDPYFLVQFIGPIKTEWLDTLAALGAEVLGYQASYTYLVRLDPALISLVDRLPAVQFSGHYHPAYRLPAEDELSQAAQRDGRYGLDLRYFPGVDGAALASQAAALGAQVEWLSAESGQMRLWAAPELLNSLAALPGVFRIEPYLPPALENEKAAQVMHTFDVRSASRNRLGVDLTGAGQVAGLVDSGLDLNSTTPAVLDFYDFTNGVQTSRIQAAVAGSGCGVLDCTCSSTDDTTSSGHGTHVAGSIAGNGYLSLLQQGLQAQARTSDPSFDYAFGVGQAPEARLVAVYTSGTDGSLCGLGSYYDTWLSAYTAGARLVNNSWGNTGFTYGGSAVSADQVMWTYQDFLLVNSAGNYGPYTIRITQPGNAKNVITVGAANNHRSAWDLSGATASLAATFSSRGPVSAVVNSNRRFKPDLMAPGANILSTRSTTIPNTSLTLWANEPGDGDANGQQDYWWSGGTSMAAPLVTGAATVVRDYLQDIQNLGDATPPSAALIKAFLVNGAVDLGYGFEAFLSAVYYYGGRNTQGWGMVNLEQSITPRAPRSFFFDDFTNITNAVHQSTRGMNSSGDYVQYTVNVVNSAEPLKISLTWTDPQTGLDTAFVNDLTLLVTAPDGSTQYFGNVFSGAWSATGGSPDAINNTEAVYVQNPASGVWTINVLAANIASGTQPYALIASGGFGANPSTSRTCSGTTDCAGRMGSSARSYSPSLTQLSGWPEQSAPGSAFTTSLRLTNGGTSSDTISLSAAAKDRNGAAAAGFTVSYNPNGPYALASGASQDVQVTVTVGPAVSAGSYDVAITATSGGSSAIRDAQVIGLNVAPAAARYNEADVIRDAGAQVTPDLWASGQNVWTAYLSAEDHLNGEADIYAACSADGGQTWSKTQIGLDYGDYYVKPAIAGKADGSQVTVVWDKADTTFLYARTWTRTSGCEGAWGNPIIISSSGSEMPDVIYDNDGTILAVWRNYPNGIYYSRSTDGGATWGSSTTIPDASGGGSPNHSQPSLALDAANNDVWLAYARLYSGIDRDIYLKRWDGDTNAWDALGTRSIVVSNSTDREIYPGIAVVDGAIWVAWNAYPDYGSETPQLYYARSGGTLPNPTFSTIYGPYGTRVAEYNPPSLTGDAENIYIAFLAVVDAARGNNVAVLQVPGAGGEPAATLRITNSVDDPPFKASGNAGAPRIAWASSTVNSRDASGPLLMYAKNSPAGQTFDYAAGLGIAQTLFNQEEDFDLYLAQIVPPPQWSVFLPAVLR